MKLILSALLVLVQLTAFGAASVPYEQLNPHHFDWAVFPEVSLKGMSRTGDLPGDIISLVGGTNYWHLVGNDLSPTVGTSVSTTNLFAYSTLNAAGALVLTGTLTTNMVAGTNDVSSLGYDVIRVTGFNASTNGSFLRLYAPGNGLGTMLVVQNYSAGSAFTMFNNSECAGGDPTMIMRLNGDWTPNRQGESIMLYNYGQGWAEIGRTPTQSITYNNMFATNIFVTSFTLGGTTITTNDLWTTVSFGGITNLQPVNLNIQPTIVKGLSVGTNTLHSVLLPSDLKYGVLESIRSENLGDVPFSDFYISQASNNGNPRSWLWSSISTNSNLFQVGAHDGTHQVEFLAQTSNGNDVQMILQKDSTVLSKFYPTISSTDIPYRLDTDKTHTSTNLLEVRNNGTNRMIVDTRSTIVGSTVTSPNFSDHAALEVSNFTDRKKALTVDIKLGDSGGLDAFPVYIFSQLTNNTAHPTITFEETSPSGYMASSHSLLSVSETPRVTNSASTWPSYVESGIIGGYFNASPSGGTNGSSMGLQGSVDPNMKAIGVGVAGYVEPHSANLSSTNVAISGTVPQLSGSQIGIGGYFEIGLPQTLPFLQSAGVLIDSHDSGAPVLLGQTNGAIQIKVNANSGYDGTGNLFLSSDGTYKTAGGGPGGDTIWTTNSTGWITPLGTGQLTNSLVFISGRASTGTNIASVIDTATAYNNEMLMNWNNAGTNRAQIDSNGGLYIGIHSYDWDGGSYPLLAIVNDASHNHSSRTELMLESFDAYGAITPLLDNYFVSGTSTNYVRSEMQNASLGQGYLVDPWISEVSTPFFFNTYTDATAAGVANLFSVGNTNTIAFKVSPSGLATATAGFASTATDAAVAITATGITNALGKNAMAYFDGTTLTFTLKTSGNSPFYTNTVSVGHAEVMLQNGEALMITSGSGTGVLKAF